MRLLPLLLTSHLTPSPKFKKQKMENYKAKFMCSYGGEIQHRAHDNQLSYVGGHTKILYVDRSIKFPAMHAKLSALFDAAGDVSFKYQLPGEDLGALISVTDDEDLGNMMLEYDQLYRASVTTARMRLFLFPNNPPSDRVVDSDPNVNHPLEVQRQLQLPASSSSSSSSLIGPLTPGKYDVFISFRGDDTRANFTCHLHEALTRKQIKTFIDCELHKGDEISPSLFRAIENSYVSVVVFSKDYASSKWCLEELVKILQCREKHGQVVIPVFYNIDPSHVRKQIGSYKEAFEKHLQNSIHGILKVRKWKDALAEAADLAGWDSHSRSYRDDSELIQKIVNDVLQKLIYHYPSNDFKGLVGIHKYSAPLESLLRKARSVGIWGISGIGKTTIARYIFDKYSYRYECSCFLENVRERSGDHGQGLHDLRGQLYSELLNEKNCQNSTAISTFLERRLCGQKNFVVLDDVSCSMQLEYLLGELQSYGSNSKIIITTRDKSVLENRRVEKIHEVEGLDFHESLTLFSLRAFHEDSREVEYEELSRRAVAYCKGVPLALVALGSFLHSKSEDEWDSALKKLEKIPNKEIQNVLQLSYDGLDDKEQQIFLDIACFLKGELKENVVNLLDSCDLYPVIGMRSLLDKALITVYKNSVWMHDLIQQMGWEVVRRESTENPGNRSRLWDFDETFDVLKNNKGTDKIQGIMLDMSQSRQNLYLSADTFKKMPNLRYLKFFISTKEHGRLCDLQLPVGLESFTNKLRHFEWHAYPLQYLPSNFFPEKLVTVCMPNGKLKRLWDGVQNLVNLKKINLAGCQELMELPDFSKAQNLKIVNLFWCRSLRHVHPSILSISTLVSLNVDWCTKLETLESQIHFRSLSFLHVRGCANLRKFSLSSEEIKMLDLSSTRVKMLHSSIGHSSKVKDIYVDGSRLENLPKELSCLKSLETLRLYRCGPQISKQHLHVIFDGLQSLRKLLFIDCHHLFELPDNIDHLSSLQELVLSGCHVERLPESIKRLSKLETLVLSNCRRLQSLPELPSSIVQLEALNCTLLSTVTSSLTNSGQQERECTSVSSSNGVNLDAEKSMYSFYQYVRELAHGYELRSRTTLWDTDNNFRICYPGCRVPEWFTYRSKGASITFELSQPLDRDFSFLLCVVFPPFSPIDFLPLNLEYICHLEDGRSSGGRCEINMKKWELDHVCMSFHRGSVLAKEATVKNQSGTKRKRVNNQSGTYSGNLKVTIQFYSYTVSMHLGNLIKECGLYTLNASDYRIKEMGLDLGMKTKTDSYS